MNERRQRALGVWVVVLWVGACGELDGGQHQAARDDLQQSRDALNFVETAGLVVMEAEHFTQNTPRGLHAWAPLSDANAAGGSALSASPDSGMLNNTGYTTSSPRLDFTATFAQSGSYRVWVRGRAPASTPGDSDSVHVGLDGSAAASADRISSFGTAYGWSRQTLDGPVAALTIPSAGVHTVNIWMREDGFVLDRLLLTRDTSFVPTGLGPAETPDDVVQPSCTPSTYEAESMNSTTGGSTPEGWNIWSNGSISTNHSFVGGEGTLCVSARGSFAAGAWPNMVVSVGSQQVGQVVVDSDVYEDYAFALSGITGTQSLSVAFNNDFYDPDAGQDRNLFVDKVVIGCLATSCGDDTCGSDETCDSCQADCGPCAECTDGETQPGGMGCGLNGRGLLEELCVMGSWQETSNCLDPDECVDGATEPEPGNCGLNGRGTLLAECVEGSWQSAAICDDADECLDDSVSAGSTSCGLNGRGEFEQLCVLGGWQDTENCLDPDICEDGARQSGGTPCGLNERGTLEEICVTGQWQDSSDCDDPDECVDGASRSGNTPCGDAGTLQEVCTAGQWEDGSACIEPEACGNGECEPSEDCTQCEIDCGACPPEAFLEVDDRIVMEAEHYDELTANGSVDSFTPAMDAAASGGQGMFVGPDNGHAFTTNVAASSPRLDFSVHFQTTGNWTMWIRGKSTTSSGWASDSCFGGLDGEPIASFFDFDQDGSLDWISKTFTIANAGLHSVHIWMREDGFFADKIVLARDGFTPSGQGPTESPRGLPVACGDGTCDAIEDCESCASDCGACAGCGNGTCEASESCTDCEIDCGACPANGLDERPANTTCVAPAPLATSYTLVDRWPNLTFSEPLGMVQAPDDDATYYVLQKTGRAIAVPENPNAAPANTRVFLDLSGAVVTTSEGGLLGMAFHPDYANNGYVYVSYTPNVPGLGFVTRVSRFQSTDGGQTLNSSTEQIVLQHQQTKFNHNASSIAFGPDGYLYLSLGDDAYQDFTRARMAAQTGNWYGKVLRLDVDSGSPYAIPPDNPFAVSGGAPEVYAYGFRNPWRFSFDRVTGDLWLADVGEDNWEEVDLVTSGGFYGWPYREADACFSNMPADCAASYLSPETAYPSPGATSITGGYVYRGEAIPTLYGKYLYGDYISGQAWLYDPVSGATDELPGSTSGGTLSSWAEDNDGELYAVRFGAGKVQKLVPDGGGGAADFPQLLTDTGCFDPNNPAQVMSGVIPYSIAQPFWSDGAIKERYLAVPDGSMLTIAANGDWELPPGGVTIKNFRHGGQLFETRFFVRHLDGSYSGYTYQWNEAETQATLVPPQGASRSLPGLEWDYPSRSQCFACHTSVANFSLGIETRQLNVDSYYPTTGRTANQLQTLDHIGLLGGSTASLAPFPAIDDVAAELESRARAYLHVNCANCHQPGGPGGGSMDLRFDTPLGGQHLCGAPPLLGDLGVSGALLLAPGNHMSSVAWLRMSDRNGTTSMPPLASRIPDAIGATVLQQWIDSLAECPAGAVLPCAVVENRVTNCAFDAGLNPWTLRQNDGGSGSHGAAGGELRVDVGNPGSLDWHVQEIQILGSLSAGSYELSFDARASSPRSIVVNLGEEGDDYSSFCQHVVNLSTEMQSFSLDCNGLPSDDFIKLDFNVGQTSSASVFVDNVYFGPHR